MNPLSVRSVVGPWGAAQHGVPDGAQVDGIEFVAGRKLVPWLAKLDGQAVDKDAAADILRKLEDRRASTDQARAAQSATQRTQ